MHGGLPPAQAERRAQSAEPVLFAMVLAALLMLVYWHIPGKCVKEGPRRLWRRLVVGFIAFLIVQYHHKVSIALFGRSVFCREPNKLIWRPTPLRSPAAAIIADYFIQGLTASQQLNYFLLASLFPFLPSFP
jgi:hypothetical protein